MILTCLSFRNSLGEHFMGSRCTITLSTQRSEGAKQSQAHSKQCVGGEGRVQNVWEMSSMHCSVGICGSSIAWGCIAGIGFGGKIKKEGVKIKEANEAERVSHEIKSMRRFHQFKQTKSHSDVLQRSMLFRHDFFFYLFVNDTAKEDKIEKKEGKQAQA